MIAAHTWKRRVCDYISIATVSLIQRETTRLQFTITDITFSQFTVERQKLWKLKGWKNSKKMLISRYLNHLPYRHNPDQLSQSIFIQ